MSSIPNIDSHLELLPLHATWNSSQGSFTWQKDDNELIALLPFGECRLFITPIDDVRKTFYVKARLRISQSVRLHSLEIRYRSRFADADQAWVPYLRPKVEMVIADQIYRSPALWAAKGKQAVALVPDVYTLKSNGKTYLDFIRREIGGKSRLAHGFGDWKVKGHIFFRKIKSRKRLPAGVEIELAHYLLLGDEARTLSLGDLASYIWRMFAIRTNEMPQVLPFAEYERLANERIFAPDLYREFVFNDKPVAAMITQTVTARRKPGVMNEKELAGYIKNQDFLAKAMGVIQTTLFLNPLGYRLLTEALHTGWMKVLPMAMFQCWFNQARTALGAALAAQRNGDAALLAKAEKIIELALNSPMDDGCFSSVCLFPENKVSWKRGTRAFFMIDSYHTPDAAVTGFHLLEWHEKIKADERIVPRCRKLAEFLLSIQDETGAVPPWVKPTGQGMEIETTLRQSASTAAPAMFWAHLNLVAPDSRWLAAAKKALAFIATEVLPEDKWFDYELLYSCAGRPTGQDGPDPFTGVYPANTLSMYWAARACLDIFLADGDVEILSLGREILDRLSLQQQAFDNPRVSVDTFGGFAVMNADGEFNDARQGLFVPLYLDWYRATGDIEIFARGIAALRASFMTMLTEDHREVAPGNLVRFRPSDRGAILENYGHTGRDEPSGGYLSPDWGCGTSLYASGMTFAEYGQVYIDVPRGEAFGIDLCRAKFDALREGVLTTEISGKIESGFEVVVNDPESMVRMLMINGKEMKKIGDKPNRYRLS